MGDTETEEKKTGWLTWVGYLCIGVALVAGYFWYRKQSQINAQMARVRKARETKPADDV